MSEHAYCLAERDGLIGWGDTPAEADAMLDALHEADAHEDPASTQEAQR
jgi:hypothetical protein